MNHGLTYPEMSVKGKRMDPALELPEQAARPSPGYEPGEGHTRRCSLEQEDEGDSGFPEHETVFSTGAGSPGQGEGLSIDTGEWKYCSPHRKTGVGFLYCSWRGKAGPKSTQFNA